MSALVEQTSRQNAGMMFFNFLRTAGVEKTQAMRQAAWLADKYMVEYNHIERPMIYGEQGMGTAGKPFGLFKTFQHNYLSHLVETIKTAKTTGETGPMLAFLGQMIFAAGIYGTIAIESADALLDKLSPYMRPLYDALHDIFEEKKLTSYLNNNLIEIVPLAFMRGRTLDNAFVILDEGQNTTHSQMKMFLTRMGKNAKFLINGDPGQIDLPGRIKSGIKEALLILKETDGIEIVRLNDGDIIRNTLVKRIINAYKNIENTN